MEHVMDKDAMNFLWEKAAGECYIRTALNTKTVDGVTLVFDPVACKWEELVISNPVPNKPEPFYAFTLDGLIEWIKKDVNHFFSGEETCIVSVVNPTKVVVCTPNKGKYNEMWELAECRYDPPRINFGTYMDSEDFGIMINVNFIESDNRNVVLQVARNLTDEYSEQTADDGISQRVTIKRGIQGINTVPFKNPAYLNPRRTFTEIMQPESPFVIRFKEGKKCAIFESDGGAWRVHAVHAIGEYLRSQLEGCNVVVIA